jgi:hypothetical protein
MAMTEDAANVLEGFIHDGMPFHEKDVPKLTNT